jgi:tRNA A-37 threonylcarbamoyl transferase component Bud32
MNTNTTAAGDQDRNFLLSLKFFKLLPENSRERFADCLQPVTISQGERVIQQGAQGDAVYFIEQGTCIIIVEKDGGERFKVAERGPAEMVGEMALITDEPRQADVIAGTELKLWKLEREHFISLVKENHDLQEFLTELVTSRLENAAHTADRTMGKFRIEHKLGHGAWAIVYQGRHMTLGKKVAIKMLKHQMAMVPEFHDRFIKEATIIGNMLHKNIINVFDVEERFNTIFIIMEYLEGIPLDAVLKNDGPLPADQVVAIFRQVCAGLAYAHQRGIVHQDIKPDNLYLMPGGQVKILDFGLACPFGSENFEMEGTIEYMSPEQIDSYPVDARTDIYCLGITAFELLTGRQPFPAGDIGKLMEMHLNEEIPDPADFIEGVPPELSTCIRKCCRRNHMERYQSATEAGHALDGLDVSGCREGKRARQNMSSLHLFYDDEQKATVTALLEDFSERAKAEGVIFQLADFDNYLNN